MRNSDQPKNLTLFDCGTLFGVGFYKPYLTIDFIVVSHKFNPNQYIHRNYEDREQIHNRINELVSDGLGYRRIHKRLVDEKWDVGTSPSCIHTMIRKMNKRKYILNQRTTTKCENISIQIFST